MALRIDILERLSKMMAGAEKKGPFEAGHEMLSLAGMTEDQFARFLGDMGYRAIQDGEKRKFQAKMRGKGKRRPKERQRIRRADDTPFAVLRELGAGGPS